MTEGTGIDDAGRCAISQELVTMVANPYLCDKTIKKQEVKIEQQPNDGVPQDPIPESHLHCYSGLAVHTPTADGQVQVTFYDESCEDALRKNISCLYYGFRITYPGQGLANEVEEFGLIPAVTQPETAPAEIVAQPKPEPAASTPMSTQTLNAIASAQHESAIQTKNDDNPKTKIRKNNQIEQIKKLMDKLEDNYQELQNDMALVINFLQYALVTPGTDPAKMGEYHDQNIKNARILRNRLEELNPSDQQSSELGSSYQSTPLMKTTTPSTKPPPVTSSNSRNKDKQQTKKKSSAATPKPHAP